MQLILIGIKVEDEKEIKASVTDLFTTICKIPSLTDFSKDILMKADINYENLNLILIDDPLLPDDPAQACQQIRDMAENPDTVIMLLVDKEMKPQSKQVVLEGCSEFLIKPVKKIEIMTRVNTCLNLQKEKRKRKASESRFFQVVENMPIIFADYEDGINAVYANKLGSQIWGMSHEEVMNPPSKWTQFIHPEDKDWVMEAICNLKQDNLYIQYRKSLCGCPRY